MNRLLYRAVFLVIGAFSMSSATGQSITGKISYSGSNAVRWSETECDGRRIVDTTLLVGRQNGLKDVLVQVKNIPVTTFDPPPNPVIIELSSCLLTPRIVAVRIGQPIKFRHADGQSHNINFLPVINKQFSVKLVSSPNNQFFPLSRNLVASAQLFDKPESSFPLRCETHTYEEGRVVVLDHPYFFVTGANGLFEIDGLPPGTYEIEAWHDLLGSKSLVVTIDNSPTEINFTF